MFKKIFKTPEYLVIFASLAFTCLVGCLVGVAGLLILNKFWGFFIIGVVSQFVIFAIVNTILQRKDLIETTKVLNQELEVASKYFINLTCAYCQIPNTTPIILNQENRFKCESCNQVNGIKMQFFSTQITTPLEKITMPALSEDKIN